MFNCQQMLALVYLGICNKQLVVITILIMLTVKCVTSEVLMVNAWQLSQDNTGLSPSDVPTVHYTSQTHHRLNCSSRPSVNSALIGQQVPNPHNNSQSQSRYYLPVGWKPVFCRKQKTLSCFMIYWKATRKPSHETFSLKRERCNSRNAYRILNIHWCFNCPWEHT